MSRRHRSGFSGFIGCHWLSSSLVVVVSWSCCTSRLQCCWCVWESLNFFVSCADFLAVACRCNSQVERQPFLSPQGLRLTTYLRPWKDWLVASSSQTLHSYLLLAFFRLGDHRESVMPSFVVFRCCLLAEFRYAWLLCVSSSKYPELSASIVDEPRQSCSTSPPWRDLPSDHHRLIGLTGI